jgi:hypothetical protein
MQVAEQFHRGGVVLPGHVEEFVLMWTPFVGDAVEIPLNEHVEWHRGAEVGTFTLLTRRSHQSATEAGRVADAVLEATEHPGRMVVVDDLGGDEVQR